MSSSRVFVRQLGLDDAESMLDVRQRNRAFLQPFEPTHHDLQFTLEGQRSMLSQSEKQFMDGSAFAFAIRCTENGPVVGKITLSNVVRGAFESCTVGYFVDQQYNGQGIATEALHMVLRFAFNHAKLHRVQAAVMPRNIASTRVVQKAGFQYEGRAPYYLKIHGVWEDHDIFSITQEIVDIKLI